MKSDCAPPISPSNVRCGCLALLISAALFAAVAPTLRWLEFSSGSENLLTATVIEMHAGGPWLVPNLNGEPRVRKPPLPAWVAAGLVPRSVIAELDSPDTKGRDEAYRRLAWSVRWPALVISCFIVLATYELGRTIADAQTGLLACAVCASSLLLLRYGRSATTDIHLALWVTATNLCLAKAWFSGRPLRWLPLAGAAAGLAFMSKGPVGMAQSALPVLVFVVVRWFWCKRRAGETGTADARGDVHRGAGWIGLIAAAILFLAVAAPWVVYVLYAVPDAWSVFYTEVTRDGATTLTADPLHTYLVLIPMMLPWSVFFMAGFIMCVRDWRRSPAEHLSLLLLVIPVIVMSLVKDKNERYLLPLVAAASIVTAFALRPQLRPTSMQSPTDRRLRQLHMAVLFSVAIGIPAAGATATLQKGGEAWWAWGYAAVAAGGLSLIPIALSFSYEKFRWLLISATTLLMFTAQAVFLHGYRSSLNGRSEMLATADAIRLHHPNAEVFYVDTRELPKALPQDLQIHLNRSVRTIYGRAALPEPTENRVLVVLQREHEPDPAIAGWRHFFRHQWGARGWHALVAE